MDRLEYQAGRARVLDMDKEPLMVTLFFTFMIAAGIGFNLARYFL